MGMYKDLCKKVLFFSWILGLLVSCGEMDNLFPSGPSNYRVSAYVNDVVIRDYSIIKNGDLLRPAFLNHIANDPDLTGLQVYIEDSKGNLMSETINYSLPNNEISERGVRVTVSDLNKEFPVFTLPRDLKIGQYTIFFNVMGGKDVLYRSTQAVYYIDNSHFSIDDIRTYLPGLCEGPQLIPPGTTILLEAGIKAGDGLDPYIVWYNGGTQIGAGKLSEHYHHLLWTVPETTGFQAIRVEVFPLVNDARPARDAKGIVKEISLPVSSKAANPVSFGPGGGEAIYWFEFKGNLESSKESLKSNTVLVKTRENPPRWEPLSDAYGLIIGPDDTYDIPGFALSLGGNDAESSLHVLNIRFAPRNEGTLFQGLLNIDDAGASPLNMEVLIEKNGLSLAIQQGAEVYKETIPLSLLESKEFIISSLNFYIHDNTFTAFLQLRKPALDTGKINVPLGGKLTGNGIFRFGAKIRNDLPAEENTQDSAPALEPVREVAIIDEFFLEHAGVKR